MATRYKKLTALAIAALMLLSGCGAAQGGETPSEPSSEDFVSTGQEVITAQAADSVFTVNYDAQAGINPIMAKSATNMQFWSLMYDSVFTVNEDFSVSSDIVTSYTSTDNTWWVFNIDTTIKFHDGSDLTARDIVYSINRARQYSYYSSRLSDIYGVSAMSADCFAITTATANSQFPSLLNIPIIKEGTLNDEVPVGSGPYMLSETGDSLVLFEDYRRADEMPIDIIYLSDYSDTAMKISAFEDSRIDIVTNDPTGMYDLGYGSSNETRYYNTTNMHYIGFNMLSSFFTSAVSRYAVSCAVDRHSIVDELMGGCGVATTLPVHPGSSLYDSKYADSFGYDMEKCKTFFKNAGVDDYDSDGGLEILVTGIVVEINIKFIVNNDSTVKLQAARDLTERLNDIGITTTLCELSWDDYIKALETGDYDMYYGELRMTPDWNLSYLFEPYEDKEAKGMNYANCFDTRYSELYAAYLGADDLTRYDRFQELCRYITENTAIAPVCFEKREILTHRGIVTGIAATQYDLFNKFYEWTIDLK